MADKNKSIDDIQKKIKRLQKEKDELERRNRENQQLEQLRTLEESISALKSSSGASTSRSDNRDISEGSYVETTTLSRLLNQSSNLSGASDRQDDFRDKSGVSDEESDVDEEMSAEHKKAILENRDILVENIIADDLFSELIAKRVLSVSDVNRIKARNSAEAKNEELLNVISKRSDRAFYVLVDALRKTLQSWLANKLDPPALKSRLKRKRKSGEVRVNVDCESIVPSSQKKVKCSCQEVEELMLQMAKNAYAAIRRKDTTPAAYEQFKKELEGTNKLIMESTEVCNTIKMICRHGKLTDISDGSVCFTVRCKSLSACEELWEAFDSGAMLQSCQVGFITPSLLKECHAKSIKLCIRISRFEYLTCAIELANEELNKFLITPLKMRLRKNKYRPDSENTESTLRRSWLKSYAYHSMSDNTKGPVFIKKVSEICHPVPSTDMKIIKKMPLAPLSSNISYHCLNSATRHQQKYSITDNEENVSPIKFPSKPKANSYNLRYRN
ncbi:hypothetical protein Btru_038292 [Bulinus truncatus]|nr:hypothetical protein Btru_038292 [Bulinus truncatus]